MERLNPLLKWWVTPKLPENHIFIDGGSRPKELSHLLGIYIRRWLVHPIKRRLAKYYLVILRKFFGIKVIGITGSTGKTSTKEMITSIVRQVGKTTSSYANIDPVYNIPSTILRCSPNTKFLVLEMSVEFPGEMDFYLWFARPDIGVLTNIYPTHTLFFGDVEGVFREKSKLVKGLNMNGVAVLNKDDKLLSKLKSNIKNRIVWFGKGTNVMSQDEKVTKDFKTEFLLILDKNTKKKTNISLPVLGKQFISNALAASGAAYALGIGIGEIKWGLEGYSPPEHRMNVIKLSSGAIIIDDSYNNNPIAAKESISTLEELPGDKVVVFGDMLELGSWEEKYHIELGKYIAKLNPKLLICVGKASRKTAYAASNILDNKSVITVSSWQEAVSPLKSNLTKGTLVLIKGSRSLGLERLVSKLS